jgi:mono/diheme cytochrome c family protein
MSLRHHAPLLTASLILVGVIVAPVRVADQPTTEDVQFFETRIRPILAEKCLKCHGPDKQKGDLRLDSAEAVAKGGGSGQPLFVAGKPEESLLLRAVRHTAGVAKMPLEGKLKDSEIADLAAWVKRGAPFPPTTKTGQDPAKHWAFQPVKRPAVPANPGRKSGGEVNPIDAFILARLEAAGLKPAPPADRRTLIRRATFDLTGLPPTPEEVDAFGKDNSPDAYEKLIDRLLASGAYGERWGRHWLDLVRYADTAGENSDHPLPHAWRYRNWVIDAFNRDVPYDEFLRDQLAGDIVAKTGPPEQYAPRVVATGFLALARRFGHDIDKDMYLTHEDAIDTVGKAFLGLTIGCARCHDHKYDPITAKDYYALYGILDSTRFAFPGCEPKQQPRDLVPLMLPTEWDRVVKPYRDKLAGIDTRLKQLRDDETKLARSLKTKSGTVLAKGEIADGGEQALDKLPAEIEVKAGQFLQLSVSPLKNHGADSTQIEWEIAEVGGKAGKWNLAADVLDDFLAGNPHADAYGNARVWWFLDIRDGLLPLPEAVRDLQGKSGLNVWRNGDTPSAFVTVGKEPVAVWTKLPARSVFVHPAPNGSVAVGWLSPIEGKVRITGRVKDAHPGGPDGVGWAVEQFAADTQTARLAIATTSSKRQTLERERAALVAAAPSQDVAFAVAEGTPHDAKLHLRGDPEKLGGVVPRRWLSVLGGNALPTTAGSGRLELAGWITGKDNPLPARVMVNRVWLHHFGKGLVKTPNDFGTRGTPPTHTELLDWLAAEFVKDGWSAKKLHKRIMLSATYRQASATRDDALKLDANNDLYWRFDRRRLSAEELRDALLATSGQLDRKPGAAHPFPPEASWNYTQHVPFSTFYESDKRSVYLVTLRNRRHPFMGLFDGADPNATTPQRQDTTVPTQALYFLNDPFFHAQAEKVATRALAKADDAARLDELFRLALQRAPTAKDREVGTAFLTRYAAAMPDATPADRAKAAWAALTRVLLASNEFLYLD